MEGMIRSLAAAICGTALAACGSGGDPPPRAGTDGAPESAALATHWRGRRADAAPAADATPAAADAAPAWPDASPFGANCGQDDECDSNRCVDYHCTIACEPDDARACREVVGLCAVVRNGRHACVGDVTSGPDGDDLVLHAGEPAHATLAGADDVDVLRLAVPPGHWRLVVTPAAGEDLAVDFYDARARGLGSADDGEGGAPESLTWDANDDLGAFALVRHVGGASGAGYAARIEAQP